MIWCVGESLYDVIFSEGQPQWAVPGGSMLNVAVSAARSGSKVSLISELGDDIVGEMIDGFLVSNGISTTYIHRYTGNTTIALAFLNPAGDARYQFYHHSPPVAPDFEIPEFGIGDVLVFGSFYSINQRNRKNITSLANAARAAGAWVYYDPNFRKPHLAELKFTLPHILENISLADFVRGSDEDFSLIAGTLSAQEAKDFVSVNGCDRFIYTRNSEGAEVFSGEVEKHYDAPRIKVVSTIGAGDGFNAGFVTILHKKSQNEIDVAFWDEAIERAVIFASEVCISRENFIRQPGNFPADL